MKLLVFAHTPPPHHGQSYMVRLMIDGFGGDHRKSNLVSGPGTERHGLTCYHVNARVSKQLEDIGDFRFGKLVLLLGYCAQAVWCRFRYGVTTLYYVPAPGKSSALYRDWLVMLCCRPFFPKVILHWHAAGLASWLETAVRMRTRSLTYQMLKQADLSIVLSDFNRADAEKLMPRNIRVVSNGIPDPCPDFDRVAQPRRAARGRARGKLADGGRLAAADLEHTGGDPQVFKILYLSHCTREKGLFDTLAAVLQADAALRAAGSLISLQLLVAGGFVTAAEQAEFNEICATPEGRRMVQYLGFVQEGVKQKILLEADLFCFPTYYQNENQPVNLIEAMAFGLPVVTTRWRSLPEMLPPGHSALVAPRSPAELARAICALLTEDSGQIFRQHFLDHFTLEQHMRHMAAVIREAGEGDEGLKAAPVVQPG